MFIGRVIGAVVATHKHPSHQGRKLLLVQPEPIAGAAPAGTSAEAILALDAADAGVGDRVLVAQEGFAAMTAVDRPGSPIDAAILGVIDEVAILGG